MTRQFSHLQVSDRLLVALRPTWTSQRCEYRSSALSNCLPHESHLQVRKSVGGEEDLELLLASGAFTAKVEDSSLATNAPAEVSVGDNVDEFPGEPVEVMGEVPLDWSPGWDDESEEDKLELESVRDLFVFILEAVGPGTTVTSEPDMESARGDTVEMAAGT